MNVYKDEQTVQRVKNRQLGLVPIRNKQSHGGSRHSTEKSHQVMREKNLTSDENSLIKLRKTKYNTVSVKFVIEIEI